MRIEFFLPMIPPTVTHQEKKIAVKNGKVIVYEPPELAEAREKFRAYLSRHKPEKPFTGALRLVTKWCWPTEGKKNNPTWKTTWPDTDNLIKLFKDCMTAEGFWKNDSIVASEITEKFWADPAGIFVGIYEL